MARINDQGYLEVKETSGKSPQCKASYRNFWIGRHHIAFKQIQIPKKYWGKRIRFKIEVHNGKTK